jgi:hypothetical protein
MNRSEWARANHGHPKTSCRWSRQGTLPVPVRKVLTRSRRSWSSSRGRLHGRRPARNRALKALRCAQEMSAPAGVIPVTSDGSTLGR